MSQLANRELNKTIYEHDPMFKSSANVDGYLRAGKSVTDTIKVVADFAQLKPKSILDYGCGHGRILRWLQHYWPEAALTGADVQKNQVDFCSKVFGCKGLLLNQKLEDISLPDKYDLIWLGSIFTHLGEADWTTLIRRLNAHLTADGVLVFSFAGQTVYDLIAAGDRFGFSAEEEQAVKDMVSSYENKGFGFIEQRVSNHTAWGRSLAEAKWVVDLCVKLGLEIVLFSERAYAKRQDIIAVKKRA